MLFFDNPKNQFKWDAPLSLTLIFHSRQTWFVRRRYLVEVEQRGMALKTSNVTFNIYTKSKTLQV